MSDTGSAGCGTSEHGSEGSTASVREDHSIITVAAEPAATDLTTVVISNGDTTDASQSNGGIDNLAFHTDTSVSTGNGDTQSPPAEAVNLELVNMTPFGEKEKLQQQGNGHHTTEIPIKNGKEADAAAVTTDSMLSENYNTDPYDEYFVPVNEHRKYIRGEKLYVTKDKRQQSKWKRTVCWGIAIAILGIAVLIAVLAAAGVILTNEEDTSMNSKLAAPATISTLPATTESSRNVTTDLPSSVTDFLPEIPYVPHALEGQLTIDDKQYEEALSRPDSKEFKELAKSIEDELKMTLFDHQTMNYGAADITIKVLEFMPGSVVVKYRVAWTFKPGIHNPPDPITKDGLQDRMSTYLQKNGGYLYVYHIPSSSVSSKLIPDPCKTNNGGCSHTCTFDYKDTLSPMCICPSDMNLAADGTTCINDLIEVPAVEYPADSVGGARHFPDVYEVHHVHQDSDHTSTHAPEEAPKPEPADDHSHHSYDHIDASPEPEPSAEPKPSVQSEVEHISEDHDHDGHTHLHKEEIKHYDHETPTSEPEPTLDEPSKPEPAPTGDLEHTQPEPEPEGDHEHSKPEPEPEGEHGHSKPEPEPEGDHERSKPEPEPAGDNEHSKPEPEPESDHEHSKPEPESEGGHERSKPEPELASDNEHSKPEPEPEGDHEHSKPEPEPTDDDKYSKPEPEPNGENEHSKPEPEPTGDHEHSKPEPEPKGDDEHSKPEPEPESDHEQSKPEPKPEGDHEHSKPESAGDNEHAKPEPEPEGDHEYSKPEPEAKSDDEHSKPEPEPKVDDENSKPEPEPTSDHEHSKPEPEPKGDPEHSKPEPQSKSDDEHSKPEVPRVDGEHSKPEPEPKVDDEHSKPEPEPKGDDEHSKHEPEPDGIHEHSKPEPEPIGDDEHSKPESKGDDEHSKPESKPESENEHSKPEPEPSDDNKHTSAELEDDHDKSKAEPELSNDTSHENEDKSEGDKSKTGQPFVNLHNTHHEHISEKHSNATETTPERSLEEGSVHHNMDEDMVHTTTSHTLEESSTDRSQESNVVHPESHETSSPQPQNSTPTPDTSSDPLENFVSKSQLEPQLVPDQVYSDHRESDDEDVFGLPVILELKPQPVHEEHSKELPSSSMMPDIHDNGETSTESEKSRENELALDVLTSDNTEKKSNEHTNETESQHGPMAMMERTHVSEHHPVEIVHLMPLNMTEEKSVKFNEEMSNDEKTEHEMDPSKHSIILPMDIESSNKTDPHTENTIISSTEKHNSIDETLNLDVMSDKVKESENKTQTSHGDNVESKDLEMMHEVTSSSVTSDATTPVSTSTSIESVVEKENSFDEDHMLFGMSDKDEDTSSKSVVSSSTVEFTPSPSTTSHIPSLEHSPTSEPELDRPEDYDANNDLLHDDEPQKPILKSPRYDDSPKEIFELHSSTTTTTKPAEVHNITKQPSDNQEINDIFIKESNPVSTESGQQATTSTTKSTETLIPVEIHTDDTPAVSEHTVEHEMKNTTETDKMKDESNKENIDLFVVHEETATKKPEKKLYKNKPIEKEEDIFESSKDKDDHKKMDRFGVAFGADQGITEDMTTTELATQQPDDISGRGKLDIRLDSDDTAVTEMTKDAEQSSKDMTMEGEMMSVPTTESQENATEMKDNDTTDKNMMEDDMKKEHIDEPLLVGDIKEEKTTENKIEEHANLESRMDSEETTDKATEESHTKLPVIEEQHEMLDSMINTTDIAKKEEETTSMDSEKKLDAMTVVITTTESVAESKTEKEAEVEHKTETVVTEKVMENKTMNEGDKMELVTEVQLDKVTEEMISEKTPAVHEVTSTSTEAATTRAPAPVHEEPEPPPLSSMSDSAPSFSKCTAGQFQCVNGTSHSGPCVSLSAKCDSINDCSDASDEIGCIEDGCPGNFQCSNGQCLKRHLVCNGIVDCNDASDEADCTNWQCKFDELRCPSGRCIPLLWQCDGKADCENHTDEQNCQASCGNQEYMCPERWCIPLSWRCNGHADCAQGDDEKLCDCSLDQFRCSAGGCVSKSQVCDGEGQCPDLSDEWGCLRVNNDTLKLEVRSAEDEWLGVCSDNWDNTWSNAACQALGYSTAVFTEYPAIEDEEAHRVLKLKPSSGNATMAPLLGALEKAPHSSCSSGKLVEISCHEFTCGSPQRTVGLEARLVGGDRAADGQWPSVALLYNAKQKAGCTASIVSPMWLLASLSCITNKDRSLSSNQWQVFAGGSVFTPDETSRMQTYEVRSIVAHPQARFNRFLYEQDVALVRVSRPLELNGHVVGAICLTSRAIEPRQLCVTAGWGYNSRNSRDGSLTQYLHYLPVPTIDLKDCNSSRHYNGLISRDHVCAGFTDAERSPCDNDEGAPLMCINEAMGVWELQGVLSYHSHCGRGYHPSIFTSVSALRPWVDSTLGSHFAATPGFNVRR